VSAPAPAIVTSQPLSTVASTAQTAPVKQAQQHSVPSPQVVMQKVPVDPLAGPVKSVTHEPTPLAPHAVAKTDVKDAHTGSEKSATVASAAKPDVKTDTKAAALKPEIKTDTRTAKAEPAAAKPVVADAKAVKAADVKPDAKSDTKGAKSKIPALRQTASAY
jgi:hypothetical protein